MAKGEALGVYNTRYAIARDSLPHLVTAVRGASVPLLFHSVVSGRHALALALLAVAVLSDVLDGFLARRLGVASAGGAVFDVFTDFLVVLGAFLGFVVLGVYPSWLAGFIVLMFAQFAATLLGGDLVYDPVGKYYGFATMTCAAVTLVSPVACEFTPLILLSVGSVSLFSRLTQQSRNRR